MTVFGVVFARGGSKGLPGKNLKKLAGKSLLERSISLGLSFPLIDKMICSTDSPEIADEARHLGADVPFLRPPQLSSDTAPEWGAWQHLAKHLVSQGASESDVLVSLPATAPLRSREDIYTAMQTFGGGAFDVVLAITESSRNPWFNMVRLDPVTNRVELAVSAHTTAVDRRQDAPQLFDITTVVYVTTLGFVLQSNRLFSGNVGSVLVPAERAVDIDTELDFQVAEFLALRRLDLKHD